MDNSFLENIKNQEIQNIYYTALFTKNKKYNMKNLPFLQKVDLEKSLELLGGVENNPNVGEEHVYIYKEPGSNQGSYDLKRIRFDSTDKSEFFTKIYLNGCNRKWTKKTAFDKCLRILRSNEPLVRGAGYSLQEERVSIKLEPGDPRKLESLSKIFTVLFLITTKIGKVTILNSFRPLSVATDVALYAIMMEIKNLFGEKDILAKSINHLEDYLESLSYNDDNGINIKFLSSGDFTKFYKKYISYKKENFSGLFFQHIKP